MRFNGSGGRFISIDSERIAECMSQWSERKMAGIHISAMGAYKAGNLDFLSNYPDVKAILVSDGTRIDLSGLMNCRDLILLTLDYFDAPLTPIPLSSFPKLHSFAGVWSPGLDLGPNCKKLRSVTLHKYKSKDLADFPLIPSASVLELIQPTIASLAGIERHTHYHKLQFERCAKLTSIGAIAGLNNGKLEDLVFSRCRKISDIETLGKMSKVTRLILEFCGELSSLDFLAGCSQLDALGFFETNVVSGDLTPLLKLPNLTFAGTGNKRHYSHTDVQLKQLLSDKPPSKARGVV